MTWVKSWQKCESYPWGQKDIKTLVWNMVVLRCLLVMQEDQSSRQLDIEFWNSGVRSLIKCTFGVYCSHVVVKAMCLMGSSKDWVWKGRSIFLIGDWGIFNNWGDKGESAKETKKGRKKTRQNGALYAKWNVSKRVWSTVSDAADLLCKMKTY